MRHIYCLAISSIRPFSLSQPPCLLRHPKCLKDNYWYGKIMYVDNIEIKYGKTILSQHELAYRRPLYKEPLMME